MPLRGNYCMPGDTVVDLDSKEAIDFVKQKGFPATPVVKTARGLHLYYRYPGDGTVKNLQKRDEFPGIDVRADGGYVVAPPSIHKSRKEYRWLNPERPLADLPRLILTQKQQVTAPLKALYHGVEEGKRNNALTKLVGSFIHDGADSEECLKMAKIWNTNNEPPLPDDELVKTVTSIYEKHQQTDIKNACELVSKAHEETRETVEQMQSSDSLSNLLTGYWSEMF